jgi:uncharacterized protein (DUF1697 family)
MKPMALVTFLRGVNVGGHRTFRPSILANQLQEYGVVNIGAAGTFVVCKPVSQTRLRSELLRRLPFEAKVMMCTGRELIAAASENPFDCERLPFRYRSFRQRVGETAPSFAIYPHSYTRRRQVAP